MKRKVWFIFVLVCTTLLIGCTTEIYNKGSIRDIEIFGLNDFHGAIQADGYPGIVELGSYLIQEKEDDSKGTVIIDQGDMFQGTALSNHSKGGYLVEFMNKIGLDSMTIGNHEFDWGLEEMERFYDGDDANYESEFPMLGANITYRNGDDVDFLKPYTIIEENDVKIGVVGVIGSSVSSSISASKVKDYTFHDEFDYVEKYATELRNKKDCDIVVLSIHDFDENLFDDLSKLEIGSHIDAIFGGHTHRICDYDLYNEDGQVIPVLQGSANGKNLSKVSIKYDINKDEVTYIDGEVIEVSDDIKINKDLESYYTEIEEETKEVFDEILTKTNNNLTKYGVTKWTADIILDKMDADFVFVNEGGIRSQAFPIYANQNVTLGMIIELAPFDNTIKSCWMTGRDILKLYGYVEDGYDLVYSSKLQNIYQIDENELYYVVSHEYVFDKSYYPFLSSNDVTIHDFFYRDVMVEYLRSYADSGWTI